MKLLQQSYVKYGLATCAILVACLTFMEVTGQNESFYHSPVVVFGTMIAPLIVWFLGIRAHKKALKNKLTFQLGVAEGFRISLVFAVVSPFIFMLYYLLVNPDILRYVAPAYGLTGQSTTIIIATDMLVQTFSALIFGTIYAAVISFFLKTK